MDMDPDRRINPMAISRPGLDLERAVPRAWAKAVFLEHAPAQAFTVLEPPAQVALLAWSGLRFAFEPTPTLNKRGVLLHSAQGISSPGNRDFKSFKCALIAVVLRTEANRLAPAVISRADKPSPTKLIPYKAPGIPETCSTNRSGLGSLRTLGPYHCLVADVRPFWRLIRQVKSGRYPSLPLRPRPIASAPPPVWNIRHHLLRPLLSISAPRNSSVPSECPTFGGLRSTLCLPPIGCISSSARGAAALWGTTDRFRVLVALRLTLGVAAAVALRRPGGSDHPPPPLGPARRAELADAQRAPWPHLRTVGPAPKELGAAPACGVPRRSPVTTHRLAMPSAEEGRAALLRLRGQLCQGYHDAERTMYEEMMPATDWLGLGWREIRRLTLVACAVASDPSVAGGRGAPPSANVAALDCLLAEAARRRRLNPHIIDLLRCGDPPPELPAPQHKERR
ncbi:hypothetical protein CSAL01_12888 [Colletotrichum salicis]|uniref:Uncharacterized protein n=1 Tax=Colletotrichum salicis TaxID=1209931 RepID=A0A135V235_9PEZI|nr:hypothetical protein CSAL01_12888 [Colletotrichum salicis]